MGAKTLAIDASEANIRIAEAHAIQDPKLTPIDPSIPKPLTYRHATSHDLVNEGRQFDLVCSLEVVEHVDNPADFLESCANLVKVGEIPLDAIRISLNFHCSRVAISYCQQSHEHH